MAALISLQMFVVVFIIIQLLAYLGLFFFNSEYLELLTYTYCNSLMLCVLKTFFVVYLILKACIQYKKKLSPLAGLFCMPHCTYILHINIAVCTPGDNCFGY